VGNKCDLETKEVTPEEAIEYAKTNNLEFFQTSAKTNINVEEAFNHLLKSILKKLEDGVIKLTDNLVQVSNLTPRKV